MWSKFAMGIIIVVLALTITGTLAKYTYTFNVTLSYLGSVDNTVVDVSDKYTEQPRFEDKKNVTADKPFMIDGVVDFWTDEIGNYMYENPTINACGSYEEGSWEYAIKKVFNTVLMPNASCLVDKGDYQITLQHPQLSVTCDDMLRCGIYSIMLDVVADQEPALAASWLFEILDVGNYRWVCTMHIIVGSPITVCDQEEGGWHYVYTGIIAKQLRPTGTFSVVPIIAIGLHDLFQWAIL